jgi:WD40 repeat protein
MMRCFQCGAEVSEQEKFCPGCGADLFQGIEAKARFGLGKHAGPVLALAYHPNGGSVASVGEDGTAYLFNFSEGRQTICSDRPGRISSVAYSPDGKYLAAGIAGAGGSTVPLLDLESGELRLELNAPNAWISALAYSPDGARIAAGTKDGALLIWGIERLLERQPEFSTVEDKPKTVQIGNDILTSVAFSPADDRLVSGSLGPLPRGRLDEQKWIWHAETGLFSDVRLPDRRLEDIRSVTFDGAGRWLACGCDDGMVYVWDLSAEDEPKSLRSPSGEAVQAVVFTQNGAKVLAGGADAIRVWDAVTGQDEGPLSENSGQVRALAMNPTGSSLASGHLDGTIYFWELGEARTRKAGSN